MRRQFAIEIPLSLFFEFPTLAEQAAIITREVARRTPRALQPDSLSGAVLLAPIRPGCTSPPLFCTYAFGGFHPLARQLGVAQPTYGLFVNPEPAGPATGQSSFLS